MIKNRLSRIRTYIRDLEGPCPNPLDDEPKTQKIDRLINHFDRSSLILCNKLGRYRI